MTGSAHAETGQGTDVFRVIMTIFGVDKSKGDIVAIVTVNDGESIKSEILGCRSTLCSFNGKSKYARG